MIAVDESRKPFFAAAGVIDDGDTLPPEKFVHFAPTPVAKIGVQIPKIIQAKSKLCRIKLRTNKEAFLSVFWMFHQIIQSKENRMH